MSQAELAARTGLTPKTVNEIVKGKAPITPETALRLERVLGRPARFWSNLERAHQERLARLRDEQRLERDLEWLERVPISRVAALGWIARRRERRERLEEVLRFFGVASREQWALLWREHQVAYRQSARFATDAEAVSAWLRRGELEAQAIPCAPYDQPRLRAVLAEARALTREPPAVFQPRLVELCAAAGVALVFVPELPRTALSGATRWLSPSKALIQLSLRYKSDDQLWFTFFHEAGHLLLHGKREVFLEGKGMDGEKEAQANRFAAVRRFAEEIGVAPGIVVGRLQHERRFSYHWGNDLKRPLRWLPASKPARGKGRR